MLYGSQAIAPRNEGAMAEEGAISHGQCQGSYQDGRAMAMEADFKQMASRNDDAIC